MVGPAFAIAAPFDRAQRSAPARDLRRGSAADTSPRPHEAVIKPGRGDTADAGDQTAVAAGAGQAQQRHLRLRAGTASRWVSHPVAGADEAGRGACAGPLVAAATILSDAKSRQISGLKDSKLLTALQRERLYAEITAKAIAWSVVCIEPGECDRLGMHVANVMALRHGSARASTCAPTYVLTDGFSVDGLGTPGLAVWKGDQVAACVAAASIIAKVTRDRIMCELDRLYPLYEFAEHKGYCTPLHQEKTGRATGPLPPTGCVSSMLPERLESIRDERGRSRTVRK